MAIPTPALALVGVLWMSSLVSSQVVKCKPVGGSPVDVQPLGDAMSDCYNVLCRTWDVVGRKWIRTTTKDGNITVFRWKPSRQDGSLVLAVATRKSGVAYFRVTETDTNWEGRIRVKCTHADDIETSGVRLFNGHKTFARTKQWNRIQNNRRCDKERPTPSPGSTCWTPSSVHAAPDNRIVKVNWKPFNAHYSIRVIIVPQNSGSHIINDTTIKYHELCMDLVTSHTFNMSSLKAGWYVAKVAAFDYECPQAPIYTVSDAFLLKEDRVDIENTLIPVIPEPKTQPKTPDQTNTVAIIVGVLAFVVLATLSITFFKWKRPYAPVRTDAPDMPGPLVVTARDDVDKDLVTLLKNLLGTEGIAPAGGDLTLQVLLQDITSCDPRTLATGCGRTVTALLDYRMSTGDCEGPLVFRIHPGLNNDPRPVQGNFHDLIRMLNPQGELQEDKCQEMIRKLHQRVRDVVAAKCDNVKKIFLLGTKDHPHHTAAFQQVAELIRQLGKDVVCFPNDRSLDRSMRKNLDEWTLQQIKEADLVIFVGSQLMYKLTYLYQHRVHFPDSYQFEDFPLCCSLALKTLSQQACRNGERMTPVAFVSFGYESEYVDKIVNLFQLLVSEFKYVLMGIDPQEEEDMDDSTVGLVSLFNRLCSDSETVKRVLSNAEHFTNSVREMMKIVKEDDEWFTSQHESVDNLFVKARAREGRTMVYSRRDSVTSQHESVDSQSASDCTRERGTVLYSRRDSDSHVFESTV